MADTIALLYGQALEIRYQLADLRTVYELAELLAGTHNLQEILDVTTQRVVQALKVKAGAIRLLMRIRTSWSSNQCVTCRSSI